MRETVSSTNSLTIDIPDQPGAEAEIVIPRRLLESLGLDEESPILLRFTREEGGRMVVVGQAGHEPPSDPGVVVARPDLPHAPDYPPSFIFTAPAGWMDDRRTGSANTPDEDGMHEHKVDRGFHEGFDLERSRQLLRPDRTMVIPV